MPGLRTFTVFPNAKGVKVKCKGCGLESLSGEGMTMVASWPFCTVCFEKLMAGGEPGRSSEATRQGEAGKAMASHLSEKPGASAGGEPACELCGAPLTEEACRVGVWKFCKLCFQDLIMTPPPLRPAQSVEASEEEKGSADSKELPPMPDLMKSIACSGCGRSIPLGGARGMDGGMFCPDCFAAHAEALSKGHLPHGGNSGFSDSGEDPSLPGSARCEACNRVLPRHRFREVEGFALCSACCATDEMLALDMARRRHRKRLEAESTRL